MLSSLRPSKESNMSTITYGNQMKSIYTYIIHHNSSHIYKLFAALYFSLRFLFPSLTPPQMLRGVLSPRHFVLCCVRRCHATEGFHLASLTPTFRLLRATHGLGDVYSKQLISPISIFIAVVEILYFIIQSTCTFQSMSYLELSPPAERRALASKCRAIAVGFKKDCGSPRGLDLRSARADAVAL